MWVRGGGLSKGRVALTPFLHPLPPGVSCLDHGHIGHGCSARCAALRQPHDEPPGDTGPGRHLHDTGKGPRSGVLVASTPISVVVVATALASHVASLTRLSTRCIIPFVHKRIECLFVLILGGGGVERQHSRLMFGSRPTSALLLSQWGGGNLLYPHRHSHEVISSLYV